MHTMDEWWRAVGSDAVFREQHAFKSPVYTHTHIVTLATGARIVLCRRVLQSWEGGKEGERYSLEKGEGRREVFQILSNRIALLTADWEYMNTTPSNWEGLQALAVTLAALDGSVADKARLLAEAEVGCELTDV